MLDRCYIHLFPGAAPGGRMNVPDSKITNLMTGNRVSFSVASNVRFEGLGARYATMEQTVTLVGFRFSGLDEL
jgi:hypothetical protein